MIKNGKPKTVANSSILEYFFSNVAQHGTRVNAMVVYLIMINDIVG